MAWGGRLGAQLKMELAAFDRRQQRVLILADTPEIGQEIVVRHGSSLGKILVRSWPYMIEGIRGSLTWHTHLRRGKIPIQTQKELVGDLGDRTGCVF